MLKLNSKKSERGQAIVLIAVAMVGLIAMVGLMTDGGMMLIEYGKLKRAVDAAAISASQQFRRGFSGADLADAAATFLNLNQSNASNIIVFRCKRDPNTGALSTTNDGTVHDEDLCTLPRRKLVRVQATRTVQFGFMRVLGFQSANLTTSAVGEAASVDLVLAIDTSASMAFETWTGSGNNPNRADNDIEDPAKCNVSVSNPCQPLTAVKNVADDFLDNMFFPYDRVAIVAMTNQLPNADPTDELPQTVLALSSDEGAVRTALGNLRAHQPPPCDLTSPTASPAGACLNYNSSNVFIGLDCPPLRFGPDLKANNADDSIKNPTTCGSSNIGGLFFQSAVEFTNGLREDSLWVILALVGGPANRTNPAASFPDGYCPETTWYDVTSPYCRDASATSRHGNGNSLYDADDYARDMADYATDPVTGQGATVFTIGLGSLMRNTTRGDANAGELLMQYAAETAGGVSANHGQYFYSPDTAGLAAIFDAIARNIFTRISR